MRKSICLVAILATAYASNAQSKQEGKVQYEITMNLHASLKPDQQQHKDLIPETATREETLYFNGNKSKLMKAGGTQETEQDGVKLKIETNEDNVEAAYMDGAAGQLWHLLNEGGKRKMELRNSKFMPVTKTGKRTKNILGFDCREVILKGGDGPMILWVTDQLPFRAGPMGIMVEEGAVLGLEQGKKIKVMAKTIDFEPVNVSDVTPPSDVQ